MSTDYPDELQYTREHEWARIDGNRAVIGITKFAVDQLGDVTQVDLPREGDMLKKDEVFGTVESVKAVSDLFAPLSGKVLKVNDPLKDTPEYVNDDCYDEGWMLEIELSNASEKSGLLSAQQYRDFLEESA